MAGNTGYPTQETLRRRAREAALRARYLVLLDTFRKLNEPGDPWMSRVSENDPDTIILIGNHIRAPADVYHFQDAENWTVVNSEKVAGMIGGRLISIPLEGIKTVRTIHGGGLEVDGQPLVASLDIAPKLAAALQAVLEQVTTERVRTEVQDRIAGDL